MKKVLIVDDSRSARFFLKSCIPTEHVDITEATDGLDGIAKYQETKPELIFMDLTMPVMDGFEAIAKIRAIDPDVRIIVLTADVQKQTQERIAELGVTTFIKKPPKKDSVREALAIAFPEGLDE